MQKPLIAITIPIFIFACTLTNGSTASGASSVQTIQAQQPTSTQVASPTPSATCRVRTNVAQGQLNLRSGPGVQYSVLAVLSEGETLSDESASSSVWHKDWLYVKTQYGRTGWVNSNYCGGAQ